MTMTFSNIRCTAGARKKPLKVVPEACVITDANHDDRVELKVTADAADYAEHGPNDAK